MSEKNKSRLKGLELSRRFFEAYGRALIEKDFAPFADRIAAGLVGPGSERYGFDDGISEDHDFCAGFCLWLSREDEEKFGFSLAKAYRHLPQEFLGVPTKEKMRAGSPRYGVMTYDNFFTPLVGKNFASLTPQDYLYTPENYLADASNGEVFYDKGGVFTKLHAKIRDGMPEDVRLKKLAACLCGMSQSGQYNYARSLSHGEEGAALLALAEFVKYAATAIHLLNHRHAPFYKWMLRSVSLLPELGYLADSLDYLLTGENSAKSAVIKGEIVEDICVSLAEFLVEKDLSDAKSDFLEAHAKHVTKRIQSVELRNLPMMVGV